MQGGNQVCRAFWVILHARDRWIVDVKCIRNFKPRQTAKKIKNFVEVKFTMWQSKAAATRATFYLFWWRDTPANVLLWKILRWLNAVIKMPRHRDRVMRQSTCTVRRMGPRKFSKKRAKTMQYVASPERNNRLHAATLLATSQNMWRKVQPNQCSTK